MPSSTLSRSFAGRDDQPAPPTAQCRDRALPSPVSSGSRAASDAVARWLSSIEVEHVLDEEVVTEAVSSQAKRTPLDIATQGQRFSEIVAEVVAKSKADEGGGTERRNASLIEAVEQFLGPHRSIHTIEIPGMSLRGGGGEKLPMRLSEPDFGGLQLTQGMHWYLQLRQLSLPLSEWRQPEFDMPLVQIVSSGYQDVLTKGEKRKHDSRPHSQLKRHLLDVWRTRLDEFVEPGDYTRNAKAVLQTTKRRVVYRVDLRPPAQLVASNGFGPSRQVEGIKPMIDEPVLVASASLRGSDGLFKSDIPSISQDGTGSYQYAIDVTDVVTASWAEHFVLSRDLAPHAGRDFMMLLDEVHVDADRISADRIYLIGSSDPVTRDSLEDRFAKEAASHIGLGVWGIRITEYQ